MNYNKEPKSLTSRRGSKASQVDIIYTTLKWSPSSTINGTLVEAVKEFENLLEGRNGPPLGIQGAGGARARAPRA